MMNKKYWLEKWKVMRCLNIPMEICDEFLHCKDGCRYENDFEIDMEEEEWG